MSEDDTLLCIKTGGTAVDGGDGGGLTVGAVPGGGGGMGVHTVETAIVWSFRSTNTSSWRPGGGGGEAGRTVGGG